MNLSSRGLIFSLIDFRDAIHARAFIAPHAPNSRCRANGAITDSGYRPMPVRLLAHRSGGPCLLTVDKNCLIHNAAPLAAGIAEAPDDSLALLISRGHLMRRNSGPVSGAILLRGLMSGFARGLGMASRLPAKGAGNVVLEEARDVDREGFARIIKEISPRRSQRHERQYRDQTG
jgi:hypothetical protein